MSKAQAKFRRSMILGILALACLVWMATDQFAIPVEDMGWLLVYTLMGVAIVIVAAGFVVAVCMGLRKVFQRKRD